MTATAIDVWRLIGRTQERLRLASADLIELRSMLATLKIPDTGRHICPNCGISLGSATKLAEHAYHAHAGPVPAAWQTAEDKERP